MFAYAICAGSPIIYKQTDNTNDRNYIEKDYLLANRTNFSFSDEILFELHLLDASGKSSGAIVYFGFSDSELVALKEPCSNLLKIVESNFDASSLIYFSGNNKIRVVSNRYSISNKIELLKTSKQEIISGKYIVPVSVSTKIIIPIGSLLYHKNEKICSITDAEITASILSMYWRKTKEKTNQCDEKKTELTWMQLFKSWFRVN